MKKPKIPDYVEIEAKSVEKNQQVCKILGIEFSSLITFGVDEIYNHYGFDLQDFGSEVLLEKDRKLKKYK